MGAFNDNCFWVHSMTIVLDAFNDNCLTSTKLLGLMFLLKDTSQHGDTGEALPAAPRSRVKHSITEPLCTGG